ncbi:MAG: GHKL domain-containing protein [Oscillospiraceae bacterium]|nr:GHKL domain-containing protein [Oscillospiraceae bacterium]
MTERTALIGLFLIFFWHALFMSKLGEPIYSRKKTTAIWFVSMAATLITDCILMYIVGLSNSAPILTVIAMIVLLVVFFNICSDSVPKKVFIVITYYNFFFLMAQSSFLLSSIVYEPDSEPYQILAIIIRNVIQLISFVLYFRYIDPKLRTVKVRQNSEWWYLSVISALFTVIYITQAMIANKVWMLPASYTPVLFAFFIQGIATFIAVFRTISYMDKTAEASLMEQNTKFLSEQIDRLMQSEENNRKLRHDIRHYVTNTSELLKSGDIEGALRYLNNWDDELSEAAVKQYCCNRTINNILSAYERKTDASNVEYICKASAAAELPVKDVHLVAILANLLENALNGCKELEAEQLRQPKIEIQIREKSSNLLIVCSNTCSDKLEILDDLPKKRGIGISSIISACGHYNGSIDYTVKDGICSVYAVLEI